MAYKSQDSLRSTSIQHFLTGKSSYTIALVEYFMQEFEQIGAVSLHPAKTMIGIATERKRIAWITQL